MSSESTAQGTPEPPALIHRLEALVERTPGEAEPALPVGPVVAASLTGLRVEIGGLEERLAAIEDTLDALAGRLEALARDSATDASERIASLDDRLAALTQTINSERNVAAQHRERTNGSLQEQAAALDEWAEAVRAGLEDLGEAVASSLGSLGATLQDPGGREADRRHIEALITELSGTVDEAFAATAEQFTEITQPLQRHLAVLSGELVAGFAAARDQLAADLTGTIGRLEQANLGTRETVEGQLAEMRADIADALEEVREHVEGTVGETGEAVVTSLGELQRDWRPRVESVVAEGRAAAQSVIERGRADLEHAMAALHDTLADQVESFHSVDGTLGAGADRLVTAGRALVAYLVERDRLLERERDRVLHELLEEFAAGLSPRERKAVASRVGEALDRRRDSRDAGRYRHAQEGRPEPEAPTPPDLAALARPIDPVKVSAPRKRPVTRRSRPAAAKAAAPRGAAKATAASKKATAAKQTGARKTTSKKTAATKTASKSASKAAAKATSRR